MAITFVGGASADGATTVALPAEAQEGDLAIVVAGRTNTNGPSIPGDWTDHGVTSGGSGGSAHGSRAGSKILTAADIAAGNVGTWTNAVEIEVAVYRGASVVSVASGTGANSATITFPARSGLAAGSWQVAMATHRSPGANTVNTRTVTNYTNRSSGFSGTRTGLWDSNGSTSGIAQQTTTVTTSSGNVGWTFGLTEQPAAQDVGGGTIASAVVLFAPTIIQTVIGGFIDAATALFAPSVAHGFTGLAVTVEIIEGTDVRATRNYPDVDALATEIITLTETERDSVTDWSALKARLIPEGTGRVRVYALQLRHEPAAQTITLPVISPTTVLFPPSLAYAVSTGTIASGTQLFAPSTAYAITGGTRPSAYAMFAPTVAPGAVAITAGFRASAVVLFPPTIVGAGAVTTGTISAATQLYAPSLRYAIVTGTVPTTLTLFAPSLAYAITTGTIPTTVVVFAPTVSVEQDIGGGTIASTVQLFAPSIFFLPTIFVRHPVVSVVSGIIGIEVVSGVMGVEIAPSVMGMEIAQSTFVTEIDAGGFGVEIETSSLGMEID